MRPQARSRSATAKAFPLASRTSTSSLLLWRSAHFSSSPNSTRREVLTTRALPGSLPSRIAPAKLSGCTSSPITLRLLLLIIVGSFLLCCLFAYCWREGGAGLRRTPHTQTSGAAPPRRGRTATRGSSVRTHSAFNRGVTPLHRSSPCRHCLPLGFCVCQSHSETTDAPTPPPVQRHFALHGNHIPSANRWPF